MDPFIALLAVSKNENLNYSLNDRTECYHYQVIYPSAYYPPPVLSHVSFHYKGKNLLFNFKNFFVKEEVIIEAAKMENWRPVNVSFWQETQQTEGAIILIALLFKSIKLQHTIPIKQL